MIYQKVRLVWLLLLGALSASAVVYWVKQRKAGKKADL
jgi:hypothetical protein